MADLVEKLKEIGFNSYEAKVYIALLKKYPATGYEVAKLANIPQARTYDTLKVLEEKIENVCGKPANIAYFQSIGDFNHIGGKLQIPTVLFGADGENFHSSDERVSLTSALEVADCIREFVSDVLSD
jgi:acetylornithine deacetylase/succinyl-diaminopimelate desuccinylase-like protein